MLGTLRIISFANILRFQESGFLMSWMVSKKAQESWARNYRFTEDRVRAQMELGGIWADFWDQVVMKSADDNAGGERMSHEDMLNNAVIFVLGGAETGSTALSGVTYLLLYNQSCRHSSLSVSISR